MVVDAPPRSGMSREEGNRMSPAGYTPSDFSATAASRVADPAAKPPERNETFSLNKEIMNEKYMSNGIGDSAVQANRKRETSSGGGVPQQVPAGGAQVEPVKRRRSEARTQAEVAGQGQPSAAMTAEARRHEIYGMQKQYNGGYWATICISKKKTVRLFHTKGGNCNFRHEARRE